jgi:hypothetical protein
MLVFAGVVLLLEFAVEEDRGEFEFIVTIVDRWLLFNCVAILLFVCWHCQKNDPWKPAPYRRTAVFRSSRKSDKTQARQSTR